MIDKQIFISYCEPERNSIMEAVRMEETCMKEYISYCGLNCETCNARLATIFNDDALREAVAALWSKLNDAEITPDMINCTGCRIPGAKTPYCDSVCPIRQCAVKKEMETCDSCPEMNSCLKVGAVLINNPDARRRLENVK